MPIGRTRPIRLYVVQQRDDFSNFQIAQQALHDHVEYLNIYLGRSTTIQIRRRSPSPHLSLNLDHHVGLTASPSHTLSSTLESWKHQRCATQCSAIASYAYNPGATESRDLRAFRDHRVKSEEDPSSHSARNSRALSWTHASR